MDKVVINEFKIQCVTMVVSYTLQQANPNT